MKSFIILDTMSSIESTIYLSALSFWSLQGVCCGAYEVCYSAFLFLFFLWWICKAVLINSYVFFITSFYTMYLGGIILGRSVVQSYKLLCQ